MYYKGKTLETIGQIFDEALRLAKEGDLNECKRFFRGYIEHIADDRGCTLDEADKIARSNIGYFAGYCDNKTVKLIYDTYDLSHPIFGNYVS